MWIRDRPKEVERLVGELRSLDGGTSKSSSLLYMLSKSCIREEALSWRGWGTCQGPGLLDPETAEEGPWELGSKECNDAEISSPTLVCIILQSCDQLKWVWVRENCSNEISGGMWSWSLYQAKDDTPHNSLVYSHTVDSDIHMNNGYVYIDGSWSGKNVAMLHQVATLICYQWSKHACSSLWYTTWGATWFVLHAVIALAKL